MQRAEIGARFAIFGTSTSTETTRQLVIIRSKKYCFWDVVHGLGESCGDYESHRQSKPVVFELPRMGAAIVAAQVAKSEAKSSWEEVEQPLCSGDQKWVEEVMDKKNY